MRKKRVSVVLPPALDGLPENDIHPAYRQLRDEEFRKALDETDYIERWRTQTEEWKAIYERVRQRMKENRMP